MFLPPAQSILSCLYIDLEYQVPCNFFNLFEIVIEVSECFEIVLTLVEAT